MFEHEVKAIVNDVVRGFLQDVVAEIRRDDMATIEQLKSKVADLETSVTDLKEIADKPAATTGISEADLDPIAAAIDQLKSEVDGVVAAHTAPAAPGQPSNPAEDTGDGSAAGTVDTL